MNSEDPEKESINWKEKTNSINQGRERENYRNRSIILMKLEEVQKRLRH